MSAPRVVIGLSAVIVAVTEDPPIVVRPVYCTSVAAKPAGATNRSAVLVTDPKAVETVARPDVADPGTTTDKDVPDADWTMDRLVLSDTTLRVAIESKPVPAIVTESPAFATDWEIDVIVGPLDILNVETLVTVVPPVVTLIVPLVAPIGTDAVKLVIVSALTVAVVPMNFTTFFAGVVQNPVPETMTLEPIVPADGEKPTMPSVVEAVRVIPVIFPAASYW